MAFERLMETVAEAPILAYPDFTFVFIMDTDASAVATGTSTVSDTGHSGKGYCPLF